MSASCCLNTCLSLLCNIALSHPMLACVRYTTPHGRANSPRSTDTTTASRASVTVSWADSLGRTGTLERSLERTNGRAAAICICVTVSTPASAARGDVSRLSVQKQVIGPRASQLRPSMASSVNNSWAIVMLSMSMCVHAWYVRVDDQHETLKWQDVTRMQAGSAASCP